VASALPFIAFPSIPALPLAASATAATAATGVPVATASAEPLRFALSAAARSGTLLGSRRGREVTSLITAEIMA
jgi:hypothetical protein